MKRIKVWELWALIIALSASVSRASAQGNYGASSSDVNSILTSLGFSLACLVVLILGIYLIKRIGGRREKLENSSGLDLMTLKKKGLLTPEEMKKVSQSIARQMVEKEAALQRKAGLVSAESILIDPEVQRLQAQVKAARQAEQELAHEAPEENAVESSVPDQDSASDVPDDESLDDVILPPDVQQLADAGILTADEILNVKRRLKVRGL